MGQIDEIHRLIIDNVSGVDESTTPQSRELRLTKILGSSVPNEVIAGIVRALYYHDAHYFPGEMAGSSDIVVPTNPDSAHFIFVKPCYVDAQFSEGNPQYLHDSLIVRVSPLGVEQPLNELVGEIANLHGLGKELRSAYIKARTRMPERKAFELGITHRLYLMRGTPGFDLARTWEQQLSRYGAIDILEKKSPVNKYAIIS